MHRAIFLALTPFLAPFLVFAAVFATPEAPAVVIPVKASGLDLLAGKRVLILGDSITQDGRWVSFLEYLLLKANPTRDFDIVSAGLASETTSGLSEKGHAGGAFTRPCIHERLTRALTAVKPSLVLACYGMNDGVYKPYDEARMRAFRDGVTKLAGAAKSAGAQTVLITPPVFDPAHVGNWGAYHGYDAEVLAKFAAWEVASPPVGVVATVDLHTPMAAALAARRAADPAFKFSRDGIHPGDLGHLVMAVEILKGLGVPVPAETPEKLLARIQADPLFPLIKVRREQRSAAWLAHIGYIREKKVPPGTGDIDAAEKTAAGRRLRIDAERRK